MILISEAFILALRFLFHTGSMLCVFCAHLCVIASSHSARRLLKHTWTDADDACASRRNCLCHNPRTRTTSCSVSQNQTLSTLPFKLEFLLKMVWEVTNPKFRPQTAAFWTQNLHEIHLRTLFGASGKLAVSAPCCEWTETFQPLAGFPFLQLNTPQWRLPYFPVASCNMPFANYDISTHFEHANSFGA